MLSKTLISLAALAAPAIAAPAKGEGKFGCIAEPSAEFLEAASVMNQQEKTGRFSGKQAAIDVKVYMHVVSAGESEAEGNVPDSQLEEQLDVLNKAYEPHDIQFSLAGTDRTVDKSWTVDGDELAMKQKLRKGGYGDLNLYFLTELDGAFGYCYFPTEAAEGSEDFQLDGCSILSTTVPGGSEENFNLGGTVPHEVGHWFGLFHTFQGSSCTGAGDQIDDTPQQLSPSSGCPTGRDSCPNAEGLDPIHNFMDYSYDACYEEFTADQETRMHNMWNEYRV